LPFAPSAREHDRGMEQPDGRGYGEIERLENGAPVRQKARDDTPPEDASCHDDASAHSKKKQARSQAIDGEQKRWPCQGFIRMLRTADPVVRGQRVIKNGLG